ncbi:uncharacterized protein [Typha latifolia]|uniref:uncharacterized protein n=1 Tax=Typha latifolia TaxID=4733 RepID=UPI003C2E5271
MGFLRRVAGLFGLGRDEAHEATDGGAGGEGGDDRTANTAASSTTRGFGVQIPVAVDRPVAGPVLVACDLGEGGVQGFRWYTRRLRIDEDGDVADEFLDEIVTEMSCTDNQIAVPKFQVKYNTRPTALAMRKQTVAIDGNIRQSLEYRGKLRWV